MSLTLFIVVKSGFQIIDYILSLALESVFIFLEKGTKLIQVRFLLIKYVYTKTNFIYLIN